MRALLVATTALALVAPVRAFASPAAVSKECVMIQPLNQSAPSSNDAAE
ncbi:MAG: hypothetical protein ABIP62_12475 [Vicinamibacteria bacterium]